MASNYPFGNDPRKVDDYITPEMLKPDEWFDDYETLLREGEETDDDMLRGASPIQVAFPVFIVSFWDLKTLAF